MTDSILPAQKVFFWAVLKFLADASDPVAREAIHEGVAVMLSLTPAERSERLRNLPHLRYRHRTGWSLSMLKNAGYVSNPGRGVWSLSDSGRRLLRENPEELDEAAYRRVLAESRQVRSMTAADSPPPAGPRPSAAGPYAAESQQTPEERIDSAATEIISAVGAELLQRIGKASAEFFEQLVLDLLRAMGYGSTEQDLERTGGPGDGGIDGVISLDRLGLEKICVQAKRWQGTVGRPDVQAFFGALAGRKVRKGVMITTSTFSREAIDYVTRVADTIVLVDGRRLTDLMIEHEVCVSYHRTIRLPRVDETYFDME